MHNQNNNDHSHSNSDPDQLQKLVVGQPYNERRNWPQGADFNYRQDQLDLRIFLNAPIHPVEKSAIESAPVQFKFLYKDNIIFVCYRFEGLPWSDCSYTWHLVPPEDRTMPDPEMPTDLRYAVTLMLAEAQSGIIQALRFFTLSPEVSRWIATHVRQQASLQFNETEYLLKIGTIYRVYPHSSQLAQIAKIGCMGGD